MAEHGGRRGIIGVRPDPRRKDGPGSDPLAPFRKDGVQPEPETGSLHPEMMKLLRNIKPFKPLMYYIPSLDWLIYLERDCSYTSKHIRGSNICLLYDNTGKKKQLVGVTIEGASAVMNPEALKKISPISGSPKKKKK